MWEKVEKFIKEQQMFSAEDVVIAGVSGGADSMCLLCVLEKISREIGFRIVVVHVNHGLRGEISDAEERYVKQICEEKGIPFEAYHVDIREIAVKEKVSEEEAGRNARRSAFEQTAEKYNGTRIALAHHKNDNAETFFLNLARGSRLRGLGGMKPVNGKYVRPLLMVSREEIETYLAEEGVTFCTDESNAVDIYTRNRIRNHVIPYLCERVNSQAVEHINDTMIFLREMQEYFDRQVGMLWKNVVEEKEDGSVFIDQKLREEEPLIRKMLLRKAMVEVSGKERDLEERHVEALERLWGKQTGRCIDLPYQLRAKRIYQGIRLCLEENIERNQTEEVILPLQEGKESGILYGKYQISWRIFEKNEEEIEVPKKTFTKWFDYDIIKKSVGVRPRRPGDRIVIDEKGNTQKLKSYFINEKVVSDQRDRIPIIAEGQQVLWIVGYRQSKAYQVSKRTTTILEIKISGGQNDGRNN